MFYIFSSSFSSRGAMPPAVPPQQPTEQPTAHSPQPTVHTAASSGQSGRESSRGTYVCHVICYVGMYFTRLNILLLPSHLLPSHLLRRKISRNYCPVLRAVILDLFPSPSVYEAFISHGINCYLPIESVMFWEAETSTRRSWYGAFIRKDL